MRAAFLKRLDSASPCGTCDNCKDARQDLCTNLQSFFLLGHLGFAEEMLSPGISAVPYDGMSPEQVCLAEPLGVAIDMHRLAEAGLDRTWWCRGSGPSGALRLIQTGAIDAKSLVTHVFEVKDIAEALRIAATQQHSALKVVVVNR